jgi:uncharacterized protein Yka (UPF0111/DUF47 family)
MPAQTAQLGIEITAEVARAVANLRNVNDEFERMGDEAKKALAEAQGAINDLGKGTVSINRLSKALQVFRQASLNATDTHSLEQYNRSIQQLEEELQRLNRIGRTVNENLPGGTVGAVEASSALTDLGRVASDLPFGFVAIQNNLDPLINSFGRAFTAAGSFSGGLKALGAAMMGPAGLGFAFSAISSLVTVAIQKYGSIGAAIEAVFMSTSELQKRQKLLNDTLLQGQQDAQNNVVGLDNLYRAATNVNVPLRERNRIADELQKMYPAIFGGLSNEAILAGNAADAYGRLREQLVAVATAEAFKNEQVKQAQELIALQSEETKIRTDISKAVERQLAAQKALSNAPSGSIGVGANVAQGYAVAVQQAANSVRKYTVDLEANAKAQGEIIATQDELAKKQQELAQKFGAAAFGISPERANETKNSVKTVADVIKDLNEDLNSLNAKFLTTNGSLRDLTEDRLKAFGNALASLTNMGLGQGNTVFDNLLLDIKSIQGVLSTIKPVPIPIKIEPIPEVNNAATIAILKENLDSFKAPLNDFTKSINAAINGVLRDGLASMFESLGEGLVTGKFTNVLKGFANVLSGYLSQLGKTLIAQGIAIEAFKKSLQSLQGVPAILAGGALIAAAGLFKALASKGPNAYATGGFAMGPQLAVVGDNPGRKEMIVPSEDFDKLGGGGNFTVTTRLSGREILLLIQRESRELNRFN